MRALFEGARPPHKAASVLAHIEGCSACRDRLASLFPNMEVPTTLLPDSYWKQPLTAAPAHVETVSDTLPEGVGHTACGSARRQGFDIPTRLGNFEVLRVLGCGGMGLVLKALDPALNRFVAVKLMFPRAATDKSSRERFSREALAAARIASDHATAVYSVGEQDGTPYIAMEYVAGENLETRLNREGKLPLPVAISIARQIAAGLAAAHSEGVVHRDIKPGNVLLEPLPEQEPGSACGLRFRVKITDFGIARSAGLPSITHAEETVGTPEYMSPEQVSGEPLDHRSDLYSFGMLLYRMVTDKLPFDAKTSMAYFARHLYTAPTPPGEHLPDLPEWLGSLIMRLIRKEPAERIQTAAEVVRILDEGLLKLQGPPADPEGKRLAALRSYHVLDTEAEQAFDDLTFLASHICGTPIALVSLIDEDRQWFKSKVGLSITQTARNISFCQHTIRGTTPLVVGDAPKDPRFAENPAVCQAPHIRFYAGVPLIDAEGAALGTLCVVDRVPKNLTPDQVSALAALGRLVMNQLAFRRELMERASAANAHPSS
jgi:serine/threonine protein kinase